LIVLKSISEAEDWTETQAYTVFACPIVADTLYPADTTYPC
jgi:hypothetical protein